MEQLETDKVVAAILTLAKLRGTEGHMTAYDLVDEYQKILKMLKPPHPKTSSGHA